jgi:PKD repeat protein
MADTLKRILPAVTATILTIMTLISCGDDEEPPDQYVNTPIAGFTYTGNEGPAPVTIQFYNTSLNADAFEWDFGDGGTTSERDPSHVYNNTSGEVKNYLVVLKAMDSSSGLYQRKSKTLAIQPGK